MPKFTLYLYCFYQIGITVCESKRVLNAIEEISK